MVFVQWENELWLLGRMIVWWRCLIKIIIILFSIDKRFDFATDASFISNSVLICSHGNSDKNYLTVNYTHIFSEFQFSLPLWYLW